MEDPLRKIAEDNLRFRRASQWGLFAALFGFLPFLITAINTKQVIWLVLSLLSVVFGFGIYTYYEKKIIGKKTAMDVELERLRAIHPDEKLELPEIDDDELKLKEMIRKGNNDDMV